MRFHAEHRFTAGVTDVIAVLTDPGFHLDLQLPDLRLLDVVDHRDDAGEARLLLRYEFVGHLDPVVKRLLGTRPLTWLQDLTVDRAGHGGRLTFALETDPQRLHGTASFVFATEGQGTVRRLEGTIKVSVPLIAATAERRIVAGFLHRLDIEAGQLAHRTSDQGTK